MWETSTVIMSYGVAKKKKTNKRDRIIGTIINQSQLCLFNNKENTYLHPATGTSSAIDLKMCDPAVYMDYNWRVPEDCILQSLRVWLSIFFWKGFNSACATILNLQMRRIANQQEMFSKIYHY